jgi:hypothetical protein
MATLERLSADPRVITPVHLAVMRIMGNVVRDYGPTEFHDFVDLHVILRSSGPGQCSAADVESRRRFRALVADIKECDPGMTTVYIAQAIASGKGRRHISSLPLLLLVPLTDDAIETTIELCVDEAAQLIREELALK